MFGLVFLSLVAFSSGKQQSNSTVAKVSDNPYIQMSTNESGYPSQVEFLQEINPESQLMSRIIFPDEDISRVSDADDARNLCDILNIQTDDPTILAWQNTVMTYLGLEGESCPIEKPVKKTTKNFLFQSSR
ncbi:uncharacterized protein [Venturia canescens]|uniref:uncharacterized protein isoform X2 n=1 Tax=Venturia canescens TaxID=32260 RepID=UPI001C9C8DDF|nr:uncharacterized protein LOC122410673 isoform X2 [Venturia canescens]